MDVMINVRAPKTLPVFALQTSLRKGIGPRVIVERTATGARVVVSEPWAVSMELGGPSRPPRPFLAEMVAAVLSGLLNRQGRWQDRSKPS